MGTWDMSPMGNDSAWDLRYRLFEKSGLNVTEFVQEALDSKDVADQRFGIHLLTTLFAGDLFDASDEGYEKQAKQALEILKGLLDDQDYCRDYETSNELGKQIRAVEKILAHDYPDDHEYTWLVTIGGCKKLCKMEGRTEEEVRKLTEAALQGGEYIDQIKKM